MRELTHQVALVTGGASGLGKAIAQRLSADGANVVITDVQPDTGQATANECGLTFFQQDVTDEARWAEIVELIERQFGRLSIVVNNAGILGSTDASNPENTALADWRKIFAINVEGVFLGCRAAIPAMRRAGGGVIINISSIAGLRATPTGMAYGASKAAVHQLTKSVAQYCAEQRLNVRCNSVHPGSVRTTLLERYGQEKARERGISIEDFFEELQALAPMGAFTLPEDVAAAVSFLVSEDARRITGTQLVVDGGSVGCDTYRAKQQ